MSYLDTPPLDTPPEGDAEADVVRIYDADRERDGYVWNLTQVFALRPKTYDVWVGLNTAIKAGMDLRRYELVTLAAARRLRSSYCALAHGSVLRKNFYDDAALGGIAADHHAAGLDATDVAVMDFAEKVVDDATRITADDIDTLRRHGLSDVDVFQVVLAAAARCFFSKVLDATGAEPDAYYRSSLPSALQAVLTVGRPIAQAPTAEPGA